MEKYECGSGINSESEEENSDFEQEAHYSVPTSPKPINVKLFIRNVIKAFILLRFTFRLHPER